MAHLIQWQMRQWINWQSILLASGRSLICHLCRKYLIFSVSLVRPYALFRLVKPAAMAIWQKNSVCPRRPLVKPVALIRLPLSSRDTGF